MSYGAAARARYADDTALTASPARLLTMLYDRLVRDLATGESAMRERKIEQTGELLGHAQEILLELRASLDLSVWPEGGPLGELYLWMVQELMDARLKLDPDKIRVCRELVEPLRDAWRAAAVQTAMTEAAGVLGDPSMASAGAGTAGQA